MRNFLFLDDSSARHDQFIDFTQVILENTPDTDYIIRHVHSYESTIKALQEIKQWEIIFLDHDLGEEDQMCIPGVNNKLKTGTDVAYYIKENNTDVKLIVLHSFNPAGRSKMSRILENNYRIYEVPFGFPYPPRVINLLKGIN